MQSVDIRAVDSHSTRLQLQDDANSVQFLPHANRTWAAFLSLSHMRQFVKEEGLGVSAFHSTNKLQRDYQTALKAGGLLSDNPVSKPCALKSVSKRYHTICRTASDWHRNIVLQYSESKYITQHQIQYLLKEC